MINNLFSYNWQVRKEWFEWCRNVQNEELTKERVGGMGSILHNLLHVINCEHIWISQMNGEPVSKKDFTKSTSLEEIIVFSNEIKKNTQQFLHTIEADLNEKILSVTTRKGVSYDFPYHKVLLHIVTHEVHHMGQLSVWAREIDKKPVSSDLIFREWK
ncbi:DinB family protein [Rossellomorea oryzaecorticis]|uniref:DinB family protein n=1 Tax=Rossellomorea oryzaecorticis TaxID=1396505 RepID=A0ABU9K6P9_9BACI